MSTSINTHESFWASDDWDNKYTDSNVKKYYFPVDLTEIKDDTLVVVDFEHDYDPYAGDSRLYPDDDYTIEMTKDEFDEMFDMLLKCKGLEFYNGDATRWQRDGSLDVAIKVNCNLYTYFETAEVLPEAFVKHYLKS